jgi:hypothetical protein
MANSESLRQVAHSRAPLSTWLGIVLLFALFGAIVLVIIGPLPRGSDYEETRAKKRIENLKALREEADKALTTYSWVDKNKGVARIPIERAMELTVADLAKQKPMPAGPIATPAPAEGTAGKPEPQATAGAATSPAPASPAPAGSPQSGGTSPAAQAPASVSPAAQSSSPNPALPSPTKSP